MPVSKKRTATAVFVTIVLAAAIWYVWLMLFGGRDKTIGSVVRKYGYTELLPPSTLLAPGTMVHVIKASPMIVSIVCPPNESFGPGLAARLLTSSSAGSKEVEELTGQFKLDPTVVKLVTTKIDSRFVRDITVTLSTVKIVELPEAVVFDLASQRNGGCRQAVQYRKASGSLSMITSVVQASALYRVTFNAGIDASARSSATRAIAGTLGLASAVKSSDTIEGDNLIWGVRDDAGLALASIGGLPPTGATTRRLLEPGGLAKVQ